jgi:hypothetical protein
MSRSLIFRFSYVGSCALLMMAVVRGQQQSAVAHVLDVKGNWHLQGSNSTIVAGESLTAGAIISAASNRPGDAITIIHDEDMSRQWVACDASTTNPCSKPITIANAPTLPQPTAQGQLKSIVESALAILLNKPPAIENHYAVTLSRGHETVQEWEDVVRLDPVQGVLLPPALADMQAGQYTVLIARNGLMSSATEQTVRLTSDGTWKPLSIATAGLYEVSVMNADGDRVADAMLLVVPSAEYEPKRKVLDTMRSRTATWTGPAAQADGHLFLRAFLLSECRSC